MKKYTNISNNKNTDIFKDLQDYMFTSDNIIRYTKHIIQIYTPKEMTIHIDDNKGKGSSNSFEPLKTNTKNKITQNIYKIKQKDSLFWCFYILKNGYSNYEMEIYNQYFVIEKAEKYKYINILRNNKDKLKLYKIKPFTEIEDDLSNKDKISVKTFFALCIMENINILLVDKRKVYELLCNDESTNIIYSNSQTHEHSIELFPNEDLIKKYRETYFKMDNFESSLKSINFYKLDELINLCEKLDIKIEHTEKRLKKKDIYELLVLNF